MNWPSLSVIIPSYNQGAFIERTLLSILKQDYPGPVQVIVSDGGSTDNTLEVLKKYPQVVWWSKKDRGFVDAVNQGLAQATGEIVAIQSSDDYYLEGAFRKAISVLMQDQDLVFVTGNDVLLSDSAPPSFPPAKPYRVLIDPGSLINKTVFDHVPQHCTFVRRSAIDQVGGLREEVDLCADFDLWYRVLHFGKAVMLPDFLAVYQEHPAQRTKNNAGLWINALKKVIEDAEANPKYAQRFVPTPDVKRNIFLQWTLFWNKIAGGEQGIQVARALSKETLEHPGLWPGYVIDTVRQYGLDPKPFSTAQKLVRALKRNDALRSFAGKPVFSRYAITPDRQVLDIGWWRGKDRTSLVKTVALRTAAVVLLSAVQVLLVNSKKPPSVATQSPGQPAGKPLGIADTSGNTEEWPSLSVIIPSYNQGAFIERTLLSILKQDYPGPVQVIVSDGGSTDNTLEVLKKYPQVVWWSKKDRGFADAVNQGLAQATGEIVAIQSSDDYYLAGAFRKAIVVLMEDQDLLFVTGSDIIREDDGSSSALPKPYVSLQNPGALISRTPWLYVPQHTTFARRTAIDLVNGLREEVDRCADFDLWYRVLHFGRAVMLPDFLAVYQKHTAQRTQNKAGLWIVAHKKVVEDAEANPKYAQRYLPAAQTKRDIFLMWETLWISLAGGSEGMEKARFLADDVLRHPNQWPDYVVDYMKPFSVALAPRRWYANSRLGRMLRYNRVVRALIGKPPLQKTVADVPDDLDWWKN